MSKKMYYGTTKGGYTEKQIDRMFEDSDFQQDFRIDPLTAQEDMKQHIDQLKTEREVKDQIAQLRNEIAESKKQVNVEPPKPKDNERKESVNIRSQGDSKPSDDSM